MTKTLEGNIVNFKIFNANHKYAALAGATIFLLAAVGAAAQVQ